MLRIWKSIQTINHYHFLRQTKSKQKRKGWQTFLDEFSTQNIHKLGKTNLVANTLSRQF